MNNGAAHDYDFGNKRHWRRWQWNRIAAKVASPWNSNVLYLAGVDDEDRKIAIEKGFNPKRMIAVDRESEVISKLRSIGTTSIRGKLSEVIRYWCGDEVHVVLADFCGGISTEVLSVSGHMMLNPCFSHSVFAFNLERGRDTLGEKLIPGLLAKFEKHRAKYVWAWHITGLVALAKAQEFYQYFEHKDKVVEADFYRNLFEVMNKLSNRHFSSYKSKIESESGRVVTLVYDSCVMHNINREDTIEFLANAERQISGVPQEPHGYLVDRRISNMKPVMKHPIARKILAARAVRTRQLNAT